MHTYVCMAALPAQLLHVCIYSLIKASLLAQSCTVSLETNYLTGLRKLSGASDGRLRHSDNHVSSGMLSMCVCVCMCVLFIIKVP